MEFRILGPLEVLEHGRRVELGGAKQRALLAVLLLDANRVVSLDRLIDALWDETPPDQARKALQVYVSQLRKALGADRIVTRDPGYVVRVEKGELDLERFRELVSAGEQERALALFRGPPLADFAGERFATVEIARLESLRLACLEDRVDADLTAGRHATVVSELEAVVREHPLRERPRAQLMLALYRSGRQAEALEAFQDARRTLVDELGIEPSRSVRELQQAILQQDPALDLPVAEVERPSDLPAPTAATLPARSRPAPAASPTTPDSRKTVTAISVSVATSAEDGRQLDPEVLGRVTTRAFAEVEAAVERHGGMIESVASDVVGAVFGLPRVHEDDALRAVRAAEEARARLAVLSEQILIDSAVRLEVRIGVSTGQVLTTGQTGLQLRATGEPLTTSSRLAQEGEPGAIFIDELTRRVVRDAVVVEPLTHASAPALRLVRLVDTERGYASRFVSPIVGRERERRRLNDAFEQALSDRSCQLFTILGPAGVGKSRLVHEFLNDVTGRATVAEGRCLPYGEGITYWPVLEAVKHVAELDDTESPEQSRLRLAAFLEANEDADHVTQRLTEVLGLVDSVAGIEEGLLAVRTFFEAVARRHPLVLVFDDIHWGEPTFLDLVEHLADWGRDAPLLLVCIARPELLDDRPGWGGGKLNATSVLLEALSDEECGRMIENVVGEADLAEEVVARIKASAEGNPLFVEEMLSMLIDDGRLVRTNGRWTATGDLAEVPVPPTIQALLATRLDQLSADERAVIERASVEGKVFHQDSVAQLASPQLAEDVATPLSALVRKELIRPERPVFSGERAFRFRHLLIRDAAYQSIPKQARASLHEHHAAWLEQKIGTRTAEYEEIVGYHLEQAFRYRAELGPVTDSMRDLGRRAAEWLGSAGRRAFARVDAPAAMNLLSRAIALLPTDDPLRVDLIPNVRAIQGTGDLGWADTILEEAIAVGDPRLRAHALVQRGFLRLFFDDSAVTPEELVDVAQGAISVFDEVGDDLGRARAWRLIAQAHYLGRDGGRSAEAAATALGFARGSGDLYEQLEIIEWLGIALVLGPAPASEGAAVCEQLLEQVAGEPRLELTLVGTLVYLLGIQGRTEEAEELIAKGRRTAEEIGETVWLFPVLLTFYAAWISDPVTAERDLRPVYEGLKKIGEQSHFCSCATMLAQAVYAQGRYDEADKLAQDAERSARPNDVHSHIIWRGTRAKVLARRGQFEAAESLAREAVEFAEQSDFLHSHADALADLAEVHRLAGRPTEAIAAIEAAIELHEAKGNVLAVERCRALLEELR
jgi:DNA-binding SARP family transcriptional activator